MTTRRPYRDPLQPEEAMDELRANAGTQFDPELVTVFWDMGAEGGLELDF
jgi:HD-GYP domain-containing protein (c-di-GMP phosphodiesterase class II)